MKTLIVIDMQHDFISEALGTPEAQAIVPSVIKKVKMYQDSGDQIIFTRDTHHENYLETSEGKNLPVVHCIAGTHGWEIHAEIDVPECLHINKESFGFIGWNLFGSEDIGEEIEVIGLCTDICVVSNVMILKSMFPEKKITVDASCCAGVTPETHIAALNTMKMCQINVVGE